MPQKVSFCSKTLHDISWINSECLENHLDPILGLLYNFHDLKKKGCRFFVLLHSICLTRSDNYSFFAIFDCSTNVKLLLLIFCNTLSKILCRKNFQILLATVNKIECNPILQLTHSKPDLLKTALKIVKKSSTKPSEHVVYITFQKIIIKLPTKSPPKMANKIAKKNPFHKNPKSHSSTWSASNLQIM